ncbi:MAG: hypothetical protein CL607_00950 [Anaerolineaceae bacterium]|nr:hypothetical protein [Anaerolineaceae bacterium]
MTSIELGVGLFWKDQSYADFVDTIEKCESLGYDELWISNEKFFREMYISATVAAQHTKHARIGTFVADPYSHHPALTAMAIGTLDEVSQGRAMLGIGAGGTGFPPMGIKRRKPALAIKEASKIIRGLLHGETVDYQGEVVQFHNGRLNFKPRPDIPIVVASRGNLVLQTGGEVADAVMIATYAEPIGIQHALSMVEKGAKRAGRSLDDISIISRVDACIHEDRQLAYEAVKPMVGVFLWTSYPDREFVNRVGLEVPDDLEKIIAKRDYNLMHENTHLIPDSFVDKFCWAGTAEEVAEKVARVVEMGINRITFLPHPPEGGDVNGTIEAFAQVVRPHIENRLT